MSKDEKFLSGDKIYRIKMVCRKGSAMKSCKDLLKERFCIVNSAPVHRILAKHAGIVKTCPTGKSLDILPDWLLITMERPLT